MLPAPPARWAEDGNGFTIVPPVDAEIFLVHGDNSMVGKKLAHADEAQISQVGVAALVSFRQLCQVRLMLRGLEGDLQHSVLDQGQNVGHGTKMKSG